MKILDWIFGERKPIIPQQSIQVTSMPRDEWTEWMLDILDEKERRTGKKIVHPYPDDY
jgi:hypothetical protein